jgi:hypothetical protein
MRAFVTLHRWWGIVFCLLFAMWFASGIVMHFVPFPVRTERPLPPGLRLVTAQTIEYDQWTVAGDYDSDRPLRRIAVNDDAGTEIYISAGSGKVVLTTTRKERLFNYVGSIAHWLYPTELRHHKHVWSGLMWWLSLLATVGATLGIVVGLVRLGGGSAYQGLQRWHHIFGLIFAPFLLAWIFSGFLSMDGGRLFFHSAELFRALHTFEFPPLTSRPWLRTSLIVGLCMGGLAFSLTGVTLAWRRLGLDGPAALVQKDGKQQ